METPTRPRTSDKVKFTHVTHNHHAPQGVISALPVASSQLQGSVHGSNNNGSSSSPPKGKRGASVAESETEARENTLLNTNPHLASIRPTSSSNSKRNLGTDSENGHSVGVGAIVGDAPESAVPFEEKGLFFHIKIRVYGHGFDPTYSHGYCVDDTPCGISHPIGELYIDIRTVTIKQLRPIIQYNRTGHMDRRSKMFQEALFIMERLVNKFERPKEDLKKYQFGWINRGNNKVTIMFTCWLSEFNRGLFCN
jgi:hypothetical protein